MKHNQLFRTEWCQSAGWLQAVTCHAQSVMGLAAPSLGVVEWGKSAGSVTPWSEQLPAWPRVTLCGKTRRLAEAGTFALGVGENGAIQGWSERLVLSPRSSGLLLSRLCCGIGQGSKGKPTGVIFKKILLICRKNKTSSFTHGRNTWRFFFCSCQWQTIPT